LRSFGRTHWEHGEGLEDFRRECLASTVSAIDGGFADKVRKSGSEHLLGTKDNWHKKIIYNSRRSSS
jgi:hypothetical protein